MEASSALFMERGYAGSGLKQIAQASGAPIGSVYLPGGTEEVAAETLRASGLAYQSLVEAVFDAAPDLVTGVEWCFDGDAETLRATDFADACPIATVALEVASSDEPLRQVTAEIFEGWLQALTARVVAGGIDPEPARELATMFQPRRRVPPQPSGKDPAPMAAIGRAMISLIRAALSSVNVEGKMTG